MEMDSNRGLAWCCGSRFGLKLQLGHLLGQASLPISDPEGRTHSSTKPNEAGKLILPSDTAKIPIHA